MVKSRGESNPLSEGNMEQKYEEVLEELNKRLTSYLRKEGLTSVTESSEKDLKRLVFAFIKDFLEYQLSFDDFSSLCEQILIELQDRSDRRDSDLFSICNYGAELNWYIRNEPVRAADFLETILEWYREPVT